MEEYIIKELFNREWDELVEVLMGEPIHKIQEYIRKYDIEPSREQVFELYDCRYATSNYAKKEQLKTIEKNVAWFRINLLPAMKKHCRKNAADYFLKNYDQYLKQQNNENQRNSSG